MSEMKYVSTVEIQGYKKRPGDDLPAGTYRFATAEERIEFVNRNWPPLEEAEPKVTVMEDDSEDEEQPPEDNKEN